MAPETTAPGGGEIEVDPDGGLRCRGGAIRLFDWLDHQFERIAREAGAHPLEAPGTIDRATLDRAGYFEAFADVAIPAGEGNATFLPPAACYHVYPTLAGARVASPRRITLATFCGRREAREAEDVGRLRRFRMREVVLVGGAEWVAAERAAWMARIAAWAASLGLHGEMEPATDTFFGSADRGRRLIQRLKGLKYELRMDAGAAGQLAVASFNLHETFFSSRFGIGPMADGTPAASGCVAFGVERWTIACLAQLGAARAAALVEGGGPRSTMNT